jgi:ABC-type Fe3+/spermidine/putrescine transport system ATPase subunit
VGSPEDIYLRPRTRFAAGFLGAVNWIGEVGLRPEVIRVSRPGERTAACWRPAKVTGSVFLGSCIHVLVRLSSGEQTVAELPRDLANFQQGDAVEICWHEEDEMRFE